MGFQVRGTWIDDYVVLEVDHFFQACGFHFEQVTKAAWHRLEEPDVGYRGGKFDMPHAFASDSRVGDFDPATIADHPLVLHPTVLSASAFPVLFRAKNTFAEQAVFFGTVGSVVDRLRLFDFSE